MIEKFPEGHCGSFANVPGLQNVETIKVSGLTSKITDLNNIYLKDKLLRKLVEELRDKDCIKTYKIPNEEIGPERMIMEINVGKPNDTHLFVYNQKFKIAKETFSLSDVTEAIYKTFPERFI